VMCRLQGAGSGLVGGSVGQLALALSMTVIGSDEGRTWRLRRKNDDGLGDCTVPLGAGVTRWSLRAKARGR